MAWFTFWPAEGPDVLDGRVKAALQAGGPVADFRTQPVAVTRKNFDTAAAALRRLNEPLKSVETRSLQGFRIRLYVPEGQGPFPGLVFFHGGGWVLGDLESHDDVCRSLAKRTPCVVVAVDYRLAPETPFPGPLDDCETAFRWTVEHARELGVDPSRVAVGGDSAGGNLAAALALRLRDRKGPKIAFQLLVYPATDMTAKGGSIDEFSRGYGLTAANMHWFWDVYAPAPARSDNPEVSPLRAKSLAGLPPAFIVTAHFDVIRDEGEEYGRKLRDAGVPVTMVRFREMNHGFLRMGGVYPQANQALTMCAEALRAGLR